MHLVYIVVTLMTAFALFYVAALNFVGAETVKDVSARVNLSETWLVPLGTILVAGALGLLIGFVLPALGVAAAIGLVLYFICALGAHIRAHDSGVGGVIAFLVLVSASLVANLAYHGQWW